MAQKDRIAATQAFGARVDFGAAASDYGRFRAGFPDAFFDRLQVEFGLTAGQRALDVGTGAGTVARALASLGLDVVGLDPSPSLMAQAIELDRERGIQVRYVEGQAEALPFDTGAFDLLTAGQCWHWFDRPKATSEAFRVLKPGARIVVAHFDWLPIAGNMVEATERLILDANPAWTLSGGSGLYPDWLGDLARGGFIGITTASFDVLQPYSHEAWRGRIRASAGVKASLDAEGVAAFDERLRRMLSADFPDDPLQVPHRVWWASARRPT
jgi:SAM-dependent methyltransferase